MPRDLDYYTRMQAQYDAMMRQIREEQETIARQREEHYRQLVYSQTAIRYMTREEAEQVYPRVTEATAGVVNSEQLAILPTPEYTYNGEVWSSRASSGLTYGELRAARSNFFGKAVKPRKKKRSHLPKWW